MKSTESDLRDHLAMERTDLANERTLLAYVRTALASAACGAALLEFFPTLESFAWLAWVLITAGGAMLAIGTYRYLVVRSRLHGDQKR